MKNLKSLLLFSILGAVLIVISCSKEDQIQEDLALEQEVPVIRYSNSQLIDDQYIVVFKDDQTPVRKANITSDNYDNALNALESFSQELLRDNKILNKDINQSFVKSLSGIALTLDSDELSRLRSDDRIDYIEQDQIISVSMGGPPGGGGGGGGSTGQQVPYGITRVGGPHDGTSSGTAWIIDSGIDLDHEDLNVDVGRSKSFLSGGGGNTSPDDYNGHGTHVAGTVAAIDNEVGVVGVAEGATVVAVRVLDRRGSGSISGVIAGVDYVAANANSSDAANMSLGGGVSTSLDNAVIAASAACPFALAAGNESRDANNSSPARANGENIYTVSSMNSSDNWSSFSNYGNPPVDYCAPGSSVLSCYKDNGYRTLSGTSMAAPHVCGLLLLGSLNSDGTVNGDPDGNPDPIAHY